MYVGFTKYIRYIRFIRFVGFSRDKVGIKRV